MLAVLQGKRIFVTGGAGFIATTLARTLVDRNEVVALDNLHRDALSATDLADHPNFSLHQADVQDQHDWQKVFKTRRASLAHLAKDGPESRKKLFAVLFPHQGADHVSSSFRPRRAW